jgi:hypothetical protein
MTGDCRACAGHGDVEGSKVCLACGGSGTDPDYVPPTRVVAKKTLPTRTLETDLVKLWIEKIPYRLPNCRAFRRAVVDDISMRGHRIIAGVEGQADVYVYVKGGTVVEVEAKMAKGRMREAQIAWAAWCKLWGINHLVVRALAGEEATATVDRWVEELRRVIG